MKLTMTVRIKRRDFDPDHPIFLELLSPVLQRILASRSIQNLEEIVYPIKKLLPYTLLKDCEKAAEFLSEAVIHQKRILIVGDFDADGATSTTVAMSCLKAFGAKNLSYLVPNRFEYGYGLTPEIVAVAARWKPDWIITVDNGIASHDGVEAARKKNIRVLITDHHLPGKNLPNADAIVNPNQPGDEFPSKSIAGVGVIFYVMLALRANLRSKNYFDEKIFIEPNLAEVLDLVALGTIADVVSLDYNNRMLVFKGLERIKKGLVRPGIQALLEIAKRSHQYLSPSDLAFAVAPRLNAAGRLDDMSLGIECLLSDNLETAREYALQLESLNQERRTIESEMQKQALSALSSIVLEDSNEDALPLGLCLFDKNWHQGVIGILASRVKEKFQRPTIVFTEASEGLLKGSGRSIRGLNMRDVLDEMATQESGLISKFGGHAMAAGLSIPSENYDRFKKCFEQQVAKYLTREDVTSTYLTDGVLHPEEITLELAQDLKNMIWGQGFPEPLFEGEFLIADQKILAEKHLKLILTSEGKEQKFFDAIFFNINRQDWPNHRAKKIFVVYRLDINFFRDISKTQLMLEYIFPC